MEKWLLLPTIFFTLILLYYSALTISGVSFRNDKKKPARVLNYPPVDVLIPAHNEGSVIRYTLESMTKLNYPGELNIYLLNDNSKDNTGEIAQEFDDVYLNIHHIQVPDGSPKGKSRVLNHGLSISSGKYFIVYDADNQPDPGAVEKLVNKAENTPEAFGVVGHIKTLNVENSWLTRMIAIEMLTFQLMMQSGRYKLFGTGALPGTNMLMKREVIETIGVYDVFALAEDAELTVRIHKHGGIIAVEPEAITYEQEPETLKVYIKQRTRWLQGNFSILWDMLKKKDYYRGKQLHQTLQHLSVYLVFLAFLLISHTWFVLSLMGHLSVAVHVPLMVLWYVSYLFFTLQLFTCLIIENNVTGKNIFAASIMYFTYSQLFILIYFWALFLFIKAKIKKKDIGWDKTVRVNVGKGKKES